MAVCRRDGLGVNRLEAGHLRIPISIIRAMNQFWSTFLSLVLSVSACLPRLVFGQGTGAVEIDLVEEKTEQPLTCRVKILNNQGRPQRARQSLYHDGWNLIEGTLLFKSRPGQFTYQVVHGPQFSAGSGGFTIDTNTSGYDVLQLPRHADLAAEGWTGGDLMCFMKPESSLRWLPAEDLQMAVHVRRQATGDDSFEPVTDADDDRWIEVNSYYDDRPGSGLIFHHWIPPAEVPDRLPSSRLLVLAKQASRNSGELPVHCEVQRLWARDVPIWLASDRIDSIQVLSDHLTAEGTKAAKFQPIVDPDPGRFRGDRGPGRLIEFIYWQVLESGLRIPPSAGSGFGRTDSPLGYNRLYAHTHKVSPAAWWQSARAGHSFVTNGPLLRTLVNGQIPGHIFQAPAGDALQLDVSLTLTVSDPVEYLDVIFNGQQLYQARLDEYAKQGGRIPALLVEESGWLVIRVITERAHTYRFATTAPYYIEIGGQPRISAAAVKFFQTWLEVSAAQTAKSPQAQAAQPFIESARAFWSRRLAEANVP